MSGPRGLGLGYRRACLWGRRQACRKTRRSPSSPKPRGAVGNDVRAIWCPASHQQPPVDRPAAPSPGKQERLLTSFPSSHCVLGACQAPFRCWDSGSEHASPVPARTELSLRCFHPRHHCSGVTFQDKAAPSLPPKPANQREASACRLWSWWQGLQRCSGEADHLSTTFGNNMSNIRIRQ